MQIKHLQVTELLREM